MNTENFKNICVVGFERSGIALSRLALALQRAVKVTDGKKETEFKDSLIKEFKSLGVEFEFGGHSVDFIKGSDLIVISPGVDLKKSTISEIANKLNIKIVGEMEFASWFTKSKIIAITGTNGKTTTTTLTYEVLKSKFKGVYLAGNIGIPLSSCVLDTKPEDIVVLEVSSFQLETILEFKPFVAAFLNLEPDHLDRYGVFDEYMKAKINLFKNQDEGDWAVLNKNCEFNEQLIEGVKSNLSYFSSEFDNENKSAVYKIVSILGVSLKDCDDIFSKFTGLPHRMQLVADVKGVSFINDSKATNPASTIWALKNTQAPTVLIAGGKDKGVDYSVVLPFLKNVTKINLIGEAAKKIEDKLAQKIPVTIFKTLEEAVEDSFSSVEDNGVVLFSPMCSSFDMFLNYEDRGNIFCEIVKKIDAEIK